MLLDLEQQVWCETHCASFRQAEKYQFQGWHYLLFIQKVALLSTLNISDLIDKWKNKCEVPMVYLLDFSIATGRCK